MGRGEAWLWAQSPGAGGSGIAVFRGNVEEAGAELLGGGGLGVGRWGSPSGQGKTGGLSRQRPNRISASKTLFLEKFPSLSQLLCVSHALGFEKAVGTCPGLLSLCVLSKDRCFTATAALLAAGGGRGEQPHRTVPRLEVPTPETGLDGERCEWITYLLTTRSCLGGKIYSVPNPHDFSCLITPASPSASLLLSLKGQEKDSSLVTFCT